MAWVTITGAGTSTATKFHGDAMNKISNMFNGTDVSDTVTIHSNVIWTFNNGALKLRNPADTQSYTITPAAIGGSYALTLPLITGADTLAALGIAQTWTGVQTFTTPILGTPTSGTLTNCTGLPLAGLTTAAKTQFIAIAGSDETTVLGAASTTVPVATFHAPYGMTLTDIKAGLTTAGTGAALLTVDVHVAGTTVMSTTKVTVDATEKTSGTAATPPVLTTTTIAEDDLIEIFVDQLDTDNVATGLKVYLIGYPT